MRRGQNLSWVDLWSFHGLVLVGRLHRHHRTEHLLVCRLALGLKSFSCDHNFILTPSNLVFQFVPLVTPTCGLYMFLSCTPLYTGALIGISVSALFESGTYLIGIEKMEH